MLLVIYATSSGIVTTRKSPRTMNHDTFADRFCEKTRRGCQAGYSTCQDVEEGRTNLSLSVDVLPTCCKLIVFVSVHT